MAVLVGIDLGTTTTLVGRAVDEEGAISVNVIDIRQGDVELSYLPSVAYFPPGEEPLVGLAAQKRGPQEDASRYVRAVKRQMGRRVLLPVVEQAPYQISALYLAKALDEARYKLPEDEIVFTVTVPASFTTNQRADTLLALREACDRVGGIHYPEDDEGKLFISEPVAAMLAFLNEEFEKPQAVRHLDFSDVRRVVVYDIGGGTLDLTRIFVEPKGSEVNGLTDLEIHVDEIGYYNPFGGEDFDLALAKVLYNRLMEQFPELQDVHLTPEQRLGVRLQLMDQAKEIKESLSDQMQSADDLLLFDEPEEATHYHSGEINVQGQLYSLEGEINESAFREAIEDLISQGGAGTQRKNLITPLDDLLTKSKLDPARLDGLLIVGGAARLPLIPEALREYWPNDRVWVFQPPDHAVVTGAALYSYLRDRADFILVEKAADAYYVRLEDRFDLILPAKKDLGKKNRYELNADADHLSLQVFAGQQKDGSDDPVLSSLVHQGGTVINLGQEYQQGTPVWVQMRYAGETSETDHTKVPWVYVWIGKEEDPPQFRRRYSELVQEVRHG
ncbi:MAG: Hsp70 family protein [Chloroflexota bacterium]|nr:Hsp70 family protein [Chloroflexota bacterium]